ncbi:MAG: adenylate/guanylate cyclase domain-containing protein [Bacteroidales bacterium]|nr:adenylate/guanylate cyclase domain-containing protein [Bacteroidales bacterium]
MNTESQEQLIKRIAGLAKQNQAFEERIKDLLKENEKLLEENEKQKALLDRVAPADLKKVSPSLADQRLLKFKMATILFADMYGFSKVMTDTDPADLMDELDGILYNFDQIAARYKLKKIKTIGDTYMCAGGIPVKNITNPVDVVMAALEMQDFLNEHEKKRQRENGQVWGVKIGIHTGPVTANITGKKKVSYDLKGDTVNTASRVEGVSEKRRILISVMTYELVREFFQCEYYGKLPVKYKGDLDIYQVMGLRPRFSVNGDGITPNEAFNIKFGLIQFTDIQEIILDKLEKDLPPYLYYHNVKHTVDVVTEVELMGWAEGCSDEEILMLKTAALFHDAGHIIDYDNHELHGAQMAREMLPRFNYSERQINTICDIIMATRLPPKPGNLLEEIICDADLDYLGRSDFIPVSNTLYDELKAQNKIGSLNDWNKLQVKFISNHQYFTSTARSLREVNKQKQIERIESLIT